MTEAPTRRGSLPSEAYRLLDHIAGPESGGRYNVRFDGSATGALFDDFTDHPRIPARIPEGFAAAGRTSTAAGRYQFVAGTWDEARAATGVPDFSEDSQDTAAWWLAQRDYRARTGRDLLADLRAGRPQREIDSVLAPTWEGLGRGEPSPVTAAVSFRAGGHASPRLTQPGTFWEAFSDSWSDNALSRLAAGSDYDRTPDPGFDPMNPAVLGERAGDWQHFVWARNQSEFDWMASRLDRERDRRRRLDAYDGWVAPLLGAMTQPENMLATVVIPGSWGLGFVRSAGRIGAANLAFEAVAEGIRAPLDPLSTPAESAMRIGSVTLFSGLLGGAFGAIGAQRARGLAREMGNDLAALGGVAPDRITTSVPLGDGANIPVRRVASGQYPREARQQGSEGVWIDPEGGVAWVDAEAVSRSWEARGWRALGMADDEGLRRFPNANVWGEFLLRLKAEEAAGAGRGMGGSPIWRVPVKELRSLDVDWDKIAQTGDVSALTAVRGVGPAKAQKALDSYRAWAAQGAAAQRLPIDRALEATAVWAKGNRAALQKRAARALSRMADTPYKRIQRNAASQDMRDLIDELTMDAGLHQIGNAAGRTVGPSVVMRAYELVRGRPTMLKMAEDAHYEAHLGFAANPRVLDVAVNKSFARARVDGSPKIPLADFRRRATLAWISGTEDPVREINAYAADIGRFFKQYDADLKEVGLLGRLSTTQKAEGVLNRVNPIIRDIEQRLASVEAAGKPGARGMTPKQVVAARNMRDMLGQLQDERAAAETALAMGGLSAKAERAYFTRVWDWVSIRNNPKSFKAHLARLSRENPTVARVVRDEKGRMSVVRETLPTDDASIQKRVETFYRQLLDQEKQPPELRQQHAVGFMQVRTMADIDNARLVGQTGDDGRMVDFIVTDPQIVANTYAQRTGPLIEFARQFDDGISARHGWMARRTRALEAEAERYGGPDLVDHLARMQRDLDFSRDRVLRQVVTEPSRLDNRVASVGRDLTHLAFMGVSALSSIPDAGNIPIAHGMGRTFRTAFRGLDLATAASFRGAVDEARMAGGLADVALNLSVARLAEVGTDPLYTTMAERMLRAGVNKFFVWNGLAPLSFGMRSLDGALRQHSLVADAIAGGARATEDLARYGIDPNMARRIAAQAQEFGERHADGFWLARTQGWTDKEAVRSFRAALAQGIDNTILVASYADKPALMDGVLHFRKNAALDAVAGRLGWRDAGAYWRVQSGLIGLPFTYWSWGLAALNKITTHAVERPSGQVVAGLIAMLGLGYMAVQLKDQIASSAANRPPMWNRMSTEQKLLRVLNDSGVTGQLVDWLYTAQAGVGATTGVNPLPIGYRYGMEPDPLDAFVDTFGGAPGSVARSLSMGGFKMATGQEGGLAQASWGMPGRNWFATRWLYEAMIDAADDGPQSRAPSRF